MDKLLNFMNIDFLIGVIFGVIIAAGILLINLKDIMHRSFCAGVLEGRRKK